MGTSVRPGGAILTIVAVVAALVAVTGPAPADAQVPVLDAACPEGEVPEAPFTDLTGGVHDPAIACLARWGLAVGNGGVYLPASTLTRGQAIRLVSRLLDVSGQPPHDGEASTRFPDTGDDPELVAAAARLDALGVLRGFADGTLRPGATLTRGQLASLAGRLATDVLDRDWPRDVGRFRDAVGSAHQVPIERLAAVGVLLGVRADRFAPGAPIRRDQVASVFVRLLDVLVREGVTTLPALGCPEGPSAPVTPALQDDCLQLNQLQVLGSHNSYKLLLPDGVRSMLALAGAHDVIAELDYEHPPLPFQLEEQGIRQIELDIFADPDGGRYAEPLGLRLFGQLPVGGVPELLDPGFKVLHAQDVDFRTSCPTLVACLEQVRSWSDGNPQHLPVAVLIEAKTSRVEDELPPDFEVPFEFVVPLPFTAEVLDALDAEILSVFDQDRIITPDDVRGEHERLEDAVLAGAWPTLAEARGKVLFLLDNRGVERDRYREGRPSLEGRVMFTSSSPGQDDAAFLQLHEPRGPTGVAIAEAVDAGYLIRTRSDTPGNEGYTGDTARRDAALASGAQFVSTDYQGVGPHSDYVVTIPDGSPGRCNPVNAPAWCRSGFLGG